MANIKKLKAVKKNRHNSSAGKRNRSKKKKSVKERKLIKRLLQRQNKEASNV